MNQMRLLHGSRFLLCLFLVAMIGCGTPGTPSANHTPPPSQCGMPGETHLQRPDSSLPAASGEWPVFRGDLMRDGAATVGGGRMLNLAWWYCTGGAVLSSPAVSAGVVYIASTNGTLSALDARSGRRLWQFRAGGALYSSPAVEHGIVYIGALNGSVYAVDAASGSLRWRSSAGEPGANIWSSPLVVNGLVIIGVASPLNEQPKIAGALLAFDAATGAQRWRVWSEQGGAPGGGIWSSATVDQARGVVYVGMGDPDDGVEALRLADGQVIWRWRSVSHDVADTDVGSGPLLYQDQRGHMRLVVGGKDGFLYSLDALSGQVLWRTHLGNQVFGSPAYAQGTLYVGAELIRRAVAWAVDAQTGAPRWQYPVPFIVYSSPAIAGQTLYLGAGDAFGAGDGGVEVFAAATGNSIQFIDLHSAITSSPAVIASWLYAGAYNGNLYAFTRSS